jgi:ribosomal protein S18 acetylase RimI-like enzyme
MDVMTGNRQRGATSLMLSVPESLPEHMRRHIREVSKIETKASHRNKGLASLLLDQVCDEADSSGVMLMLTVEPYEQGRTKQELVDWYERFGFEKLQDEPYLMARKPYG